MISEDNTYFQVLVSMSKTSDHLLGIPIFVIFESDTELLEPLSFGVQGGVEGCSKYSMSWLLLTDWQFSSCRGFENQRCCDIMSAGSRLLGAYVKSCLRRQYRSAISGGSWTSEFSLELWNINPSAFMTFVASGSKRCNSLEDARLSGSAIILQGNSGVIINCFLVWSSITESRILGWLCKEEENNELQICCVELVCIFCKAPKQVEILSQSSFIMYSRSTFTGWQPSSTMRLPRSSKYFLRRV